MADIDFLEDDSDDDARYQEYIRRGGIGNRNLQRKMAKAEAQRGENGGAKIPDQLYATNPFASLIPKTGKQENVAPNDKLYEENPFANLIPKEEEKQPELPWFIKALQSYGMNKNKPLSQGVPERLAATGRGLTDVGEGIKQFVLEDAENHGIIDPGKTALYTKQRELERKAYEQTDGAGDPLNQAIRGAAAEIPTMAALGPLGMEGKLLARVGASAAAGAAQQGVKFTPENESRLRNMMLGATVGAAVPGAMALPGGVKKVAEKVTPSLISRIVGSELSPRELARNVEVAAGTKTGLGDVIGSPSMKFIKENVLEKIPFTGAEQSTKETGREILSRGENIVNRYLGQNHPMEVSGKLGESLVKADATQTKIKNELYKTVDDVAEKTAFQLKLPDFSDKLREHADGLMSRNIFDFEPKIKKLVTDIAAGNNARNLSVKEANIMAGKLNRMADEYAQSPNISDRNSARVLGELGRSLKGDIKSEIKDSGNTALIDAFDTAEKNYKDNFSDFLEKDLRKFTHGDKSADDLLTTFLRTSKKSDKADQLGKLMAALPEEDHDLVRAAYFSRAIEGAEDMKAVNPNKLKTLWTDLGDNQKQMLIPDPKQRREFDNYVMLVGKNQKAVNLMWNPQTGQINSSIVTAIMAMHPGMALKDIIAGRASTKVLTNEQMRRNVVAGIIKRKRRNP